MNTHANRFYTASKCRLLFLIDIHVISFLGAFYKMNYSPEEKSSYIMHVNTLKHSLVEELTMSALYLRRLTVTTVMTS